MYHVMLVDDEPIVKVALRTMIPWDELGFPICGTASDGLEALSLVDKLAPDIIITDLKMPKMDGLELIKELIDRGYLGKIIVASNFGEYELVRQALVLGAVDYLLKISIKKDNLIEQLHKTALLLQRERLTIEEQKTRDKLIQSNLKSVKNAILKDFFTDPSYEESRLYEHEHLILHNRNAPCYLLYVTFDHAAASESRRQQPVSAMFIENIILDALAKVDGAETVQVEKSCLLVLIPKQQLQEHAIRYRGFIDKIVSLLQMYVSIIPSIVYTSEVQGYSEAKRAFVACRNAVQVNFYAHQSVLSLDTVSLQNSMEGFQAAELSSRIIAACENQDMAEATQQLTLLVQQAGVKSVHPDAVKRFIVKCLDYISISSQRLVWMDDDRAESGKASILHAKNAKELIERTLDTLQSFGYRYGGGPEVLYKKEVQLAIAYIRNHYQDKITLEMISDHVNLSENYLCRVFKEQVGTSIVSYLNKLRMDKAAELIVTGSSYMKEVASSVGISDQFYFNRLFKKYFGVNPTEYKVRTPSRL